MHIEEFSKVRDRKSNGIPHVAVDHCEGAFDHEKFGWLPVIQVKTKPLLATKLHERLNPTRHSVIKTTVWDQDGVEMKFKLASNS